MPTHLPEISSRHASEPALPAGFWRMTGCVTTDHSPSSPCPRLPSLRLCPGPSAGSPALVHVGALWPGHLCPVDALPPAFQQVSAGHFFTLCPRHMLTCASPPFLPSLPPATARRHGFSWLHTLVLHPCALQPQQGVSRGPPASPTHLDWSCPLLWALRAPQLASSVCPVQACARCAVGTC